MTSVFCPGHISCTFRPIRTHDVLMTGSIGVGIRLSLGSTATVVPRDDGILRITINGEEAEAPVTRYALSGAFRGQGMDVDIVHDLPVSQGFGTSASGTLAACIAGCVEFGKDVENAIVATHISEVEKGGGLGDLHAILSGYHVPIRSMPGLAPHGEVKDSGLRMERFSLAVFEDEMETSSILGNPAFTELINRGGDTAMQVFRSQQDAEGLFRASNTFSGVSGLESPQVRKAISSVRDQGFHAGMCMIGHSIFSDAPIGVLRDLFPDAGTYECSSNSDPIRVIRKE